ncbi:NAD-dependent succinate-semialdehyde dehydrogenase [Nocardioides marmoriginsengisoli]|uniref:NAD-dependent succinate-semialdehyde dehydrogenase n=1 Tax=Nocardioides marmoriginsengisoli TaxID=661483 RepID=A0A3N0CIJ6_9ACTN|nr:NAD-dependent succinate-semialdehyde dehydrogenase [Nocardioides marmoriginsengisoli]
MVLPADLPTGVLIHGEFVGTATTFAVHDPASTALIAEVADGGTGEAARAVDAAAAAFPAWSQTPPRGRSEVLRRAYELMIAEREELAALICLENGKSLDDARGEVTYAAEFFRWFSEEAVRIDGDYGVAPAGGTRTLVTQKPVGVAALATPWNFPAAMATRKIAPALAAGCTVVLKPAAETPLTALVIGDILTRAGAPAGVVNIVATTDPAGVVSTWLTDERVTKLSFTGSTAVGRTLLRQTADRVLNTTMELGGNAPFIVTGDADVAAAVRGAMLAKFRNGGQACTAANRLYIHDAVADEFTARFGAAVEALRVGPGYAPDTQVGPLVSERAVAGVGRLVDEAVADGATIAHRAHVPEHGWYYPPTVLTGVRPDAALVSEEIFGPVAPIITWRDRDELIEQANSTELGLASYVFSRDVRDALQIAERLDTGMVGINRGIVSDPAAPFGGTKQSGLGREGASEGIKAFQETQYYSVDWA